MSLFSFMHHDDEIPKNKQVQDLELSKIFLTAINHGVNFLMIQLKN